MGREAQVVSEDPQPASDLYVVEGTDVFPVHKRRCSSLTNCLAASSQSTACQFAAHAAQWQDGTAGVLTAERPASPKTPRKLDLAGLGLAELFAASRRGGVQQDRCCIGLEDVQLG